MDAIDLVGKKLTGKVERDAIHIALMPAVLGKGWWNAGDEVKVSVQDRIDGLPVVIPAESFYGDKPIGVIDPFFSREHDKRPKEGDKVFVLMRPKKVTGMRHEWECKEIDKPKKMSDEEKWLRLFAEKWNFDFKQLIDAASSGEEDYVTARGKDLHGPSELGDDLTLFWHNLEKYTKTEYSDEHREKLGWSCSC